MLFVDQPLAIRLERAHMWRSVYHVQARARLVPEAQALAAPFAGGYALYAGPGSPLNHAVGLGLDQPIGEDELVAVEQFYAERGEPARVDLCPLGDPALGELLRRRGYGLERFDTILVCGLPHPLPLPNDNVRITRATPADAERWIAVTARGFSTDDQADPAQTIFSAPNFHAENASCFLAFIGEELVGGGAFYHHAGVAEMGGTSTRRPFRRRGVQRALLAHRLEAASARGCDLAMSMTEPGSVSQRNIERAGFRVAYTRVVMIRP